MSTKKKSVTKVTFSTIEIRGYNMVLGDNPSCSRGPPIQLGWSYHVELPSTTSVDEYEGIYYTQEEERQMSLLAEGDEKASKHPEVSKRHRRTKIEMLLPSAVREAILRSDGYSRKDIEKVVKEVQKIQLSRQKHATQTLRQMKRAEIVESISTKPFKKLTFRSRRSNDDLMKSWYDKSTSSSSTSTTTRTTSPTKGIMKEKYSPYYHFDQDLFKLPYGKRQEEPDEATESTFETSSTSLTMAKPSSSSSYSLTSSSCSTSTLIDDTLSMIESNRRNRILSRQLI